jgi:hypothetical protein
MERNREQHERRTANGGADEGADSSALDALRADGLRRQDATDRIIANALSGDSERFLRGSRQRGGQ